MLRAAAALTTASGRAAASRRVARAGLPRRGAASEARGADAAGAGGGGAGGGSVVSMYMRRTAVFGAVMAAGAAAGGYSYVRGWWQRTSAAYARSPEEAVESAREGAELIAAIVGVNALVWLRWQSSVPAVREFMERWFMRANVVRPGAPPRLLSGMLSVYSHKGFGHLFGNMAGLVFLGWPTLVSRELPGMPLEVQGPRLSPGEFMALYTAAGMGASALQDRFMTSLGMRSAGLGASGALFGIMTYYALRFPDAPVAIDQFIALPAEPVFAGLCAYNVSVVISQVVDVRNGRAAHMSSTGAVAHLAGAAIGALWFWANKLYAQMEAQRESSRPNSSGSQRPEETAFRAVSSFAGVGPAPFSTAQPANVAMSARGAAQAPPGVCVDCRSPASVCVQCAKRRTFRALQASRAAREGGAGGH